MVRPGIGFMLVATASFAVVNFLVKWLDRIPISEIVFFRSAITLAITSILILRKGLPYFGVNKPWLIARGIFGVSALFLFFSTIKELPMATATTVQYLSPVFTVMMAMFLLKETVRPLRWLFFAIALCGAIMMEGYQPDPNWFFLALGVISALLSGMAYNAIVKVKSTDDPLTVVLYFPLIATPVTLVWMLTEWVTPGFQELIFLILIGLFTQIAQYFMTKALHAEKTAVVTPFKYLGTIYALLFGYFFFDETFTFLSFMGMILVILGVLTNAFVK